MPATAFVDGVITALSDARVPVTDRGFLWGDHVFEVIRTAGGHLCDGEPHLDRLERSAQRIAMAPPDRDAIRRAMLATIAAAAEPALSLRVIWTGGDGRRMGQRTGPARLVVLADPLDPAPPEPVRMIVHQGPRVGGLVPADAKTGNYLASVLAFAAATAAGAHDVVFVDGDRVLETASASLFVVGSDGAIATPTGALLPGVTALRVSALLGELGHPVIHRPVTLGELRGAAELFTTSARRGVVPVVSLDGVDRDQGPVTDRARAAYDAWIERVARGPLV